MEITNLNRTSVVHAPVSSHDSKSNSGPTHLTKNGVWGLKDTPLTTLQNDQNLVLQVLKITILDTEKSTTPSNKMPKAKITLSDGVAFILAIVVEASFDKFVQAPSQYDVI